MGSEKYEYRVCLKVRMVLLFGVVRCRCMEEIVVSVGWGYEFLGMMMCDGERKEFLIFF